MKVLLVLEATLGGTSRHILDLANGLLDRGTDVHLVYSTLRADRGFVKGLASLRANWPGFQCHEIPITRAVTISDFSSYLKLRRYVREYGPFDLIHAHSTKAGFLSRLPLGSSGARLVYTPHGLMTMNPGLTGLRRRAVCTLESALERRCDTVVVLSAEERRCALETGIDPAKITMIPNGIQPTRQLEDSRRSMNLSPDTVCVGFVSRFFSYKEPSRVVEAFSLLRQQTGTPVRLAMIGSGALEADLRRQVAASNLSKDVLFLGDVDGAMHMPAFDVLSHTSRFEAFPYVFLEALSAGVPIVTTRVGGAEELVTNGVTGYICDAWDPCSFANYLRLIVDHPDRRREMSQAARERASRYSVINMVGSIAQLYEQLCARPNPVPAQPPKYETSPGNSR